MRGRAASQVRTMNPATPQLSHGMRQAQDPCEEAWGEGAGEAAAGGDGGAVVRRGQSGATCGSTAADVAVADVADMGGDNARLLDGRGREGGESDGLEPGASHHRDAADHAPDTHSRRQGGEKGRENWERGALSAESIQEGIREGGPVLSYETTTTASAGSGREAVTGLGQRRIWRQWRSLMIHHSRPATRPPTQRWRATATARRVGQRRGGAMALHCEAATQYFFFHYSEEFKPDLRQRRENVGL